MPLKIRLSRGGNKKRPHYRIVLADSRAPRDGRFIERLGTYNPLLSKDNDQRIVFNEERIKYWLKNGAKPSDRITKFLSQAKIMEDIKKYILSLNHDFFQKIICKTQWCDNVNCSGNEISNHV